MQYLSTIQQPFSFAERDQERLTMRDEYRKAVKEARRRRPQFKANPLPPSTYEDRYRQLLLDEMTRQDRIKERAAQLFAESKLPTRCGLLGKNFSWDTDTDLNNVLSHKGHSFRYLQCSSQVDHTSSPAINFSNYFRMELSASASRPRAASVDGRRRGDARSDLRRPYNTRKLGHVPDFRKLHEEFETRLMQARKRAI